MTIDKELIEAVIAQLKQNFKEAVIVLLCYILYRQDAKGNEKDLRILEKEREISLMNAEYRKERLAHIDFVTYTNTRLQRALDTADSRLQRLKQ